MGNNASQITQGKIVTFHYTLTDSEGTVLDRSGDEAMPYLHGASNIVPGLERQMEGRSVGDKFRAVVPPEEGYGVREGIAQPVPRSAFPDDAEIEVGMQVVAEGPGGEVVPLWVVNTTPNEVELDPNHPLAGETLIFEVEVTEIRAATEEEIEHGHPHGPNAHVH
jgi:FKBP-type peptidyl-prolyl cis-trans isomerase SlyD